MEEKPKNTSLRHEVPEKKIGWWDLPHEMRSMVIEKMDDETRLTFLLVSDTCAMDMAQNYTTEIIFRNSRLRIAMKQDIHFHTLDFSPVADRECTITYSRSLSKPCIWKIVETGPVLEVIAKYFQRVMISVTEMETINIRSRSFPLEKTNIRHLKMIEDLFITEKSPSDLFDAGFIDFDQLSLISKTIHLRNKSLTYSHLQQVKATEIELDSENITSEDVNRYLKSFENGQLHENLRDIKLFLTGKNKIEIEKIMDGLNVFGKKEDSVSSQFFLVSAISPVRAAYVRLHCNALYMMRIGWWDLPHEMRSMIVDKMDDETKLSFLLCSDDCALDMARNYITDIIFRSAALEIVVKQKNSQHTLIFSSHSVGKCIVTYGRYSWAPDIWKMKETGPLLEVLDTYYRRLMISVTVMESITFHSSPRSESTRIQYSKKLNIPGVFEIDPSKNGFIEFQQFSFISKALYFQHKTCTRSTVTDVELDTKITSKYIYQYLKAFENGELYECMRDVKLFFDPVYKIHIEKVMAGLNMFGKKEDNMCVSFYLVNPMNMVRIAFVQFHNNVFSITIRAKKIFYQSRLFREKYALDIDRYLESLPKKHI